MVTSNYNPALVALSLGIAIIASFTALGLARRVATSTGATARAWLAAGAFSMGTGIWTMHFVGMLALDADMTLQYDPWITLASLIVGIAASAFALYIAARCDENLRKLTLAAVALGLGIAGMHYTGMAAMIMPARLDYDLGIVALSIVIAIAAAMAALWISARLATTERAGLWRFKLGAAVLMGLAICGMHYMGMAAASYVPDPVHAGTPAAASDALIPEPLMAAGVAAAALLILLATQATLFFDYKLNSHERLGEKLQALLAERTSTLERQTAYLRASTDQLLREVEENRRLSVIVEQATTAISVTNAQGRIEYVNPQFEREFGYSLGELRGKTAVEMGWSRSQPAVHDEILATALRGETWSGHVRSMSRDGKIIDHDVVVSPILSAERDVTHYVEIRRDVTERLRLEQQLRQAQKLEAIGQLAAGIAHEINTPSQYVGDNTRFLQDAFGELGALVDGVRRLACAAAPVESGVLRSLLDRADAAYLMTEIPRAIEQSLEGIGRVTRIVRAMKEFSHPAQDKALVDINRAIESTITVATNEWKYVADVELDLDKNLPQISCMPGDFNQVILNMIVNAAHAIADANGGSTRRGTITVATRLAGDSVEVRITDTGTGIPDEIKERIFDPFFTTKSVGQGTGQGLSIAHTVIVEKHGGSISVESKPGEGACFIVRLPLEGPAKSSVAA